MILNTLVSSSRMVEAVIHLLFCFAVLFILFTRLRIHWAVWLLWGHFVRSKRDEAHLHMLLDKSVPPYTFTKKHLSPRFTLLFIWIITVMFAVKLPWNCSNVFHHCRFAPYAPLMPPLKGIFPHLFASHYLQKKTARVCEKDVYSFRGELCEVWENNRADDITVLKCSKNPPRSCHPPGLMHVCTKCLAKHLLNIQPADPPLPEPRWKLKTPLSFIKGSEAFCVSGAWQVNRIKSKDATCKSLNFKGQVQLKVKM